LAHQTAVLTKVKKALTLDDDNGALPATYSEQAAKLGTVRLGQCPVVKPAARLYPVRAALLFSHQFSAVMVLEFSQFHGPLGPSFSPFVLVRCGDVGLELAYLCGSRGRHIYPFAVEVPFRLPCAQIARATDIRMVGMNATFDLRNASKWTFRGGRRFSRRGCDPQG
jgi:hypothetical protein